MIYLILLPVLFAVLRMITGKYAFSALTTLACAALTLSDAPVMAAALAVSAVGDYFMAHKGNREILYVCGIAGFFLGHVLLIAYAMTDVQNFKAGLYAGAALGAFFMPYLLMRVIRKVPKLLKLPVVLYTLISLLGLSCAVTTGNVLYIVGIASLLFSDTMIAEYDFVGSKAAGALILPTYYLSHILVTLSTFI